MAKRFRLRFTFWLDMQKADEAELAETIDVLKQERTFASTIRDGIRLICDLQGRAGGRALELFPWVREALQSAPAATGRRRASGTDRPAGSAADRPGQCARFSPHLTHRRRSAQKGRAAVEVTASKASAETVAKNFLTSMKGLASGFFD